jgi:chemotaxis protein MotA
MAEPTVPQAPTPDLSYVGPDPVLRPLPEMSGIDWTTLGGLIAAHVMIVGALAFGGSLGAFADLPAIFIVIGGTIAVTIICFRWADIKQAWPILKRVFVHTGHDVQVLARTLVDMSIVVRKRGTLALAGHERLWRTHPLLYPYVAMVVDGFTPQEIERMAAQELDTSLDIYRKASSILRRAAEAAPGMGLIGTLIGLVQMLGDLQSPETLGPSMAIALLTTFYGVLLGTVILTPLANKIERNANLEATERQMILTAACAMSVIDNPRRVEMALNSFLPPEQRLSYLTREFG